MSTTAITALTVSAVIAVVDMSVCHTVVLFQNDAS